MKFDWQQRTSLGIVLIALAYFVAHTTNQQKLISPSNPAPISPPKDDSLRASGSSGNESSELETLPNTKKKPSTPAAKLSVPNTAPSTPYIDLARPGYTYSPNTPESPGFKQTYLDTVTLKLGKERLQFSRQKLLASGAKMPVILPDWGQLPMMAYMQGDTFYVDVGLWGELNDPYPIALIENELVEQRPGWDKNFNDHALEVAMYATGENGEEKAAPMFQMIREDLHDITVNGMFLLSDDPGAELESPTHVVGIGKPKQFNFEFAVGTVFLMITPDGIHKTRLNIPGYTELQMKLKPIFKYPSWKYPGQYAD